MNTTMRELKVLGFLQLIGISDLSRNLPGTVERSIKQTVKPLIFADGSVVSRNTAARFNLVSTILQRSHRFMLYQAELAKKERRISLSNPFPVLYYYSPCLPIDFVRAIR